MRTLLPTASSCPLGLHSMLMFSPGVSIVDTHLLAAGGARVAHTVATAHGQARWCVAQARAATRAYAQRESHTRTVLSADAVASAWLLLGCQHSWSTLSLWSRSVPNSLPCDTRGAMSTGTPHATLSALANPIHKQASKAWCQQACNPWWVEGDGASTTVQRQRAWQRARQCARVRGDTCAARVDVQGHTGHCQRPYARGPCCPHSITAPWHPKTRRPTCCHCSSTQRCAPSWSAQQADAHARAETRMPPAPCGLATPHRPSAHLLRPHFHCRCHRRHETATWWRTAARAVADGRAEPARQLWFKDVSINPTSFEVAVGL